MGRSAPCVLFAQTFVHAQLDDHVDEVLFAEPVVISACEILEHNSPSTSQSVSLIGATVPSSFALEIFIQCEGEARFRRLCQPFLYSHSSSNVLEVEALVTNHLVIRGTYRSLTLIIYGNTAEDLGQFNIEFDDSCLSNLVTSAEANIEDLPLALHSVSKTAEEPLTALTILSLPVFSLDVPIALRNFLHLFLKAVDLPHLKDSLHKVVSAVVDASCSYIDKISYKEVTHQNFLQNCVSKLFEEISHNITETKNGLNDLLVKLSEDNNFEKLGDLPSNEIETDSKELVEILSKYLCFKKTSILGDDQLPQKENVIWVLCVALFLCSSQESLFHFVRSSGLRHLGSVFSVDHVNSSSVALLLLAVIDQATQHSSGCESILGWWPRKSIISPSGISDGYTNLLNLCIQRERHDVASISTYLLHRLRFYEIASRYESAVLSLIRGNSDTEDNTATSKLLFIKSQLCNILKLLNIRGPLEDPSPFAKASKSLLLGQPEFLLSYESTHSLIRSSCFSSWDVDPRLLVLLKERGFLPLSAALLSSSAIRLKEGYELEAFFSIASNIAAILISLMTCRSGLIFLSLEPELAGTVVDSLRGFNDVKKEECVPLRYASALISKGYVCNLREVGTIMDMHLRVVNAVDRLLVSTPYSDDFFWILWELCGISRSDCGRQALLALVHFPEAITILLEALHSFKESGPEITISGTSPINLATFHSAAEIFEIIVTDSTASSLNLWIEHAKELHEALNSSSPGSIRKDAPTRLLELVDAGVVYHKNGVVGLLRYSAVLACGDDANWGSSNISVDMNDVEVITNDTAGGSDINVIDNLGKIILEKTFDGVALRDSSIVQLTTAVRILAFLSENSTVAIALYDEGAVTVLCAILINCSYMLERFSNNHDYLVDDVTEANSTSDLLLERNREQSVIELIIPSLVLLINLMQKLKEIKEQHRNTKLMNALLRLHREVSPRLAACAGDLSCSYSALALGFGSASHLVVSALTCWPIYGWAPGLFNTLLANVQPSSSLLALGPKETCSLLCILNDLLPEEGVWLWESGMPLLSGVRKLAVTTILGTQKEMNINWYLKPMHTEKLLCHLSPHLYCVSEIILHYVISSLVVIQDMLRVFIVRLGCLKPDNASVLLKPLLAFIHSSISNASSALELDVYKVYKYLDFLSTLLEHPCGKALLLELELVKLLAYVLEKCSSDIEFTNSSMVGFTVAKLCLPVFNSLSLLCNSTTNRLDVISLSTNDCSLILPFILRFLEVLPDGPELLSCAQLFNTFSIISEGRIALVENSSNVITRDAEMNPENDHETEQNTDRKNPFSLLHCFQNLNNALGSSFVIESLTVISSACLRFSFHEDHRINTDALRVIKGYFGDEDDSLGIVTIQQIISTLASKESPSSILHEAIQSCNYLSSLLSNTLTEPPPMPHSLEQQTTDVLDDNQINDKFLYECPLPQHISTKRKLPPVDPTSTKRTKPHGLPADPTPSAPPRRDTFRQRKPNTSRPPSMHVDDYVARERGADSSVVSLPRSTSTSGRPPSIHVDEFMARQKDRNNSALSPVANPSSSKNDAVAITESTEKSTLLTSDLDDDIDIVFDGEEAETDDKLPFSDDVIPVEQNSPQNDAEFVKPSANVGPSVPPAILPPPLAPKHTPRPPFFSNHPLVSSLSEFPIPIGNANVRPSMLSSPGGSIHPISAPYLAAPFGASKAPYEHSFSASKAPYEHSFGASKPPYEHSFSASKPAFEHSFNASKPAFEHSFNASKPAFEHSFNASKPAYENSFTASPQMVFRQSESPPIHQMRPLQPPLMRRPQMWPQIEQIHTMQQPPQTVMANHEVAHHQRQVDVGLSLHEYFKDPAAIASLLSNKEELCRLLEQHPKLMQMLQERLGQQ